MHERHNSETENPAGECCSQSTKKHDSAISFIIAETSDSDIYEDKGVDVVLEKTGEIPDPVAMRHQALFFLIWKNNQKQNNCNPLATH